MVTIRSSTPERWRGVNCMSSLTWASCLAYLCRRQPRPDDRVSKSCTPTSFFCTCPEGVKSGTIFLIDVARTDIVLSQKFIPTKTKYSIIDSLFARIILCYCFPNKLLKPIR